MRKVLIAITSLYGGGAERVAVSWGNYLSFRGYDVKFLVYGRCENEYAMDESIPVMTVAQTYEEYKKLNYFERLFKMRKAIKSFNPDVVINFLPRMQIWMMFALTLIKTVRIETVRNNPDIVCSSSRFEKMLWNLCFKKADKIIIQTEEQALYFGKRERNKCIVIRNSVSKEFETVYKREYGESNNRFVAVGRIAEQKNYKMMFKAFADAYSQNKNLSLDVYGTGKEDDIGSLNQYIASLNMSDVIKIKGRVNNVPERLITYDAFLMTSDFEGMPNALIEGMAAGLPSISTDCKTGPKDIIKNGEDGFLIPVGDTEKCRDAILKVSHLGKSESQKIGKKAREKIYSICSEKNKEILDVIIAM